MPTLVHGTDAFNALELAPLESAVDDPGYPSQYYRIPLAGETMAVTRELTPTSPEISAGGAIKTLDYGAGFWRGTFRTRLYYNARWMHMLFGHLMGGQEGLSLDRMVNGGAGSPSTIANSHWHIPQSYKSNLVGSESAIPWGLSMRVSKMGPDNLAGSIQKILRCYVTSCTIEFAAGQWATATWEILGPQPTTLDGTGITPIAADTADWAVKPKDLSNNTAGTKLPTLCSADFGTGIGVRNIMRGTVIIRNHLEFPGRFLTSYNTDNNIGHVRQVEVTAEFESLLEQDEFSLVAGRVGTTGINPGTFTPGVRRFRFTSAVETATHSAETPMVDAANDIPYAFEIAAPNGRVESAPQAPIESGGTLRLRWGERWFVGTIPNTGFANTTAYQAPLIIATTINRSDEPAPLDTKFLSTAEGGNDPHSTLL